MGKETPAWEGWTDRADPERPKCPPRAGRRVGRDQGDHNFHPRRVGGAGRGQDNQPFYLGGWAGRGGAGPLPTGLTWEEYVTQQLYLGGTDLQFHVAMLLDALGALHHQRFHQPKRWDQWVGHCRTFLQASSITTEGSIIPNDDCIEAQRPEELIALDEQLRQEIVLGTIDLRNNV